MDVRRIEPGIGAERPAQSRPSSDDLIRLSGSDGLEPIAPLDLARKP